MALGAFQANAQEQLADHRRHFIGTATVAVQRGSPVVPSAAFGRHQPTSERVVRNIVAKLLTNPVVVVKHRLDSNAVRIGTKQVRPVPSPMIGVLGTILKPIHAHLAAAFFTGIKKLTNLLR